MAECKTYACKSCGFEVSAWDEGNPYISTEDGRRHYFYHPGGVEEVRSILAEEARRELSNAEFEKLVKERAGNAPDHLCPDCGNVSKLDPPKDNLTCGKCDSKRIFDIWECQGKSCPKCDGLFSEGISSGIS